MGPPKSNVYHPLPGSLLTTRSRVMSQIFDYANTTRVTLLLTYPMDQSISGSTSRVRTLAMLLLQCHPPKNNWKLLLIPSRYLGRPLLVTFSPPLVYPHLAVATLAFIHLWDVNNGEIIQKIDLSQLHVLGAPQDVELKDRYIITSFRRSIVVFFLGDGTCPKCIPIIPLADLSRFSIIVHESPPSSEGDQVIKASILPRDLKRDDRRLVFSEILAGNNYLHTFEFILKRYRSCLG